MTSRALSAVDDVVTVERPGRRSLKKRRHCARPWACEATVAMSAIFASGCMTRQWRMSMTCSPRMVAELLNEKLSSVAVTEPSREFSFATTPNSHLPRSTQSNTSSNEAHSTRFGSSMPSRAANARAASSV